MKPRHCDHCCQSLTGGGCWSPELIKLLVEEFRRWQRVKSQRSSNSKCTSAVFIPTSAEHIVRFLPQIFTTMLFCSGEASLILPRASSHVKPEPSLHRFRCVVSCASMLQFRLMWKTWLKHMKTSETLWQNTSVKSHSNEECTRCESVVEKQGLKWTSRQQICEKRLKNSVW